MALLTAKVYAVLELQLPKSEYGAKKIRRLVHNKFTKRSRLTEDSIVNRIRESTVERLSKECTDHDEIWVAWDERPHLKNVGELTMKMKLRKNKQKTARKQELNIQLFNRGYYFSLKKPFIRQYELIFVFSFAA